MTKTILIKNWLILCCFMVIFMIFIGGLTRLTDSGLSIVEWKPVSGIIPPLNSHQWQDEFTKYQQFPEYQQKNINMTLSEFKFIFWLEFIHRLAGRITGLLYLLPLVYFLINKQLDSKSILIYLTVLILFFAQGFMGWYMVKSGLSLQPYVSHFRLACHLILAIIIYSLLFYQLLNNNGEILLVSQETNLSKQKIFCIISITIIYIQIFLGGLVAGLDAGLVYNDFPLMGSSFIPQEVTTFNFNLIGFSDPVIIQFIHRIGAYITCLSIILLSVSLIKTSHLKLKKVAYIIVLALILQMLVGIITILYQVPIFIALVHQLFAVILLSCILWCYFFINKSRYCYNIDVMRQLDSGSNGLSDQVRND